VASAPQFFGLVSGCVPRYAIPANNVLTGPIHGRRM